MFIEQIGYGRIGSGGIAIGSGIILISMELFIYFKVKIVNREDQVFKSVKSSYDSYMTWIAGR